MSTSSRLETLQAMAEKRPSDAMIQYGLGAEYRKLGRLDEAAAAFRACVAANPSYTAAWQELGSVLVESGNTEEARGAFREGLEVADRTGAWKAREHMRRLLDSLESANDCEGQADGFCE